MLAAVCKWHLSVSSGEEGTRGHMQTDTHAQQLSDTNTLRKKDSVRTDGRLNEDSAGSNIFIELHSHV